jgi:hypothetical protein
MNPELRDILELLGIAGFFAFIPWAIVEIYHYLESNK